jgi:hypothetical protein
MKHIHVFYKVTEGSYEDKTTEIVHSKLNNNELGRAEANALAEAHSDAVFIYGEELTVTRKQTTVEIPH